MLASVLNQHPDLHVTALSPILELMYYTEAYFLQHSEPYAADPCPAGKTSVLSNIPHNYYQHISKPYIMDNNRAWPNNVDRIRKYITNDVKIVCIVRSVPNILASFVDLIERSRTLGENFVDRWLVEQGLPLTTENRCMYLMQPTGIVNQSLWSMYQGYSGANRDCMHLVEYDDLVSQPVITLDKITKFLGIARYEFNFNNIVNVTPVDDVTYNLPGMHSVRSRLEHRSIDPVQVLGAELVNKYSGLEYWKKPVGGKYKIFGI
jgi:sulfotransferase